MFLQEMNMHEELTKQRKLKVSSKIFRMIT